LIGVASFIVSAAGEQRQPREFLVAQDREFVQDCAKSWEKPGMWYPGIPAETSARTGMYETNGEFRKRIGIASTARNLMDCLQSGPITL
jgi:hypothetical protein